MSKKSKKYQPLAPDSEAAGLDPNQDAPVVMDELFQKLHSNDVSDGSLSRQEENWLFMTLLQMPWHYADKIEKEEDRKFLLARAEQIKRMAIAQQEQQMREMQMQQEQMAPQGQEGKILTPTDFMPPN